MLDAYRRVRRGLVGLEICDKGPASACLLGPRQAEEPAVWPTAVQLPQQGQPGREPPGPAAVSPSSLSPRYTDGQLPGTRTGRFRVYPAATTWQASGLGSGRADDCDPLGLGGHDHPSVVRHQLPEIVAQ